MSASKSKGEFSHRILRDLHKAVKAEARSQGKTVSEAVSEALSAWLKEGPSWRAYLREQAKRPEASERGKLQRDDLPPTRLRKQRFA